MYQPTPISKLKPLFSLFPKCRIGIMGDFCIDAYWSLDTEEREISIETGKPTYAVKKQRYSLGGAGNIVSNLKALKVGHVSCIGVIGGDIFGREMRAQMENAGVNHSMLLTQKNRWDTPVYGKPYWSEEELDRLDFGRFNQISIPSELRLIENLQAIVPKLDVLILNNQLSQSIYTASVWNTILKMAKEYRNCKIIVDFRQLPKIIDGLWIKLNATEAARYCKHNIGLSSQLNHCKTFAKLIHEKSQKPVIITRGERGILTFDGDQFSSVPGIHITQATDIVGAGDTTLATVAAVIGSGHSHQSAAELANYAAAVSIQKLQQTGTATPKEVEEIARNAQFVHAPEIAHDIRNATYWKGSDIEIINPNIKWGKIKWAVFDHDGTISVLREGWEPIMEAMMLKSLLGDHHSNIGESKLSNMRKQVQTYILHSAGMQTVDQMKWLAEQVEDYGFVEKVHILTGEAYKDLFLNDLLTHIKGRTDRVQKGELSVSDVTIKGAVNCLKAFADRGVDLALLSGTDHEYVIQEAELLNYAHFFKKRIYGALAHSDAHEKQNVLNKIFKENKLKGYELLALGDGPNEIRAVKKLGGIAIGIASDEVRRYGLNPSKRKRLIQAGADVIISDFSQLEKLCELIFNDLR